MTVDELVTALNKCHPKAEVFVAGEALKWLTPTVQSVTQDVYGWYSSDGTVERVVELNLDE